AGRSAASGLVREHLANERTFLAWIRTSLGLIGLGFVLARMGLFLHQLALMEGQPSAPKLRPGHEFVIFGIVFLVIGTILAGWSGWLYHRTRRDIDAGTYEPIVATVSTVAILVVGGGLILVGLVVWRLLASQGF